MKYLLLVALGLFLFVANWWYVRTVYQALVSKRLPSVVACFRYVGYDDPKGLKGQAMAQMLAARLASLQSELRSAQDALSPVAPRSDRTKDAPDDATEIRLAARVIDVPDVKLKVSGVDLSGIFQWVYRGLVESRAVRVTVCCSEAPKKFAVACDLDTSGIDSIWLKDVAPDDVQVVNEVALEILRRHAMSASTLSEAAGLDRSEFARLIEALVGAATLNQKLKNDAEPTKAEYAKVVADLEPILARTPRWRALVQLAAEAAYNSRDFAKAVEYSQQELALIDATAEMGLQLQPRRAEVMQRIADLTAALNPNAAKNVAPVAADTWTTWPLNMMAVPTKAGPAGMSRVAVLGGSPLEEQLVDLGPAHTVLAVTHDVRQSRELREYVGMLAAAVRLVSPNAHLIFDPVPSQRGSMGIADIEASATRLIEAKPDVLLITLGSEGESPIIQIYQRLLRNAPDAMIAVISVPNSGSSSDQSQTRIDLTPWVPLRSTRTMLAASIDVNGHEAWFSHVTDGASVEWAPGVNIPLRIHCGEALVEQHRSGNSFAAALIAGAAARLKSGQPTLSADTITSLLRKSAKAAESTGPSVIHLADAIREASTLSKNLP